MTTVAASIPVLRWAAQRARLHDEELSARFRKWPLWLSGEAQPTLKQLEDFAKLTHTAIGFFFLRNAADRKNQVRAGDYLLERLRPRQQAVLCC